MSSEETFDIESLPIRKKDMEAKQKFGKVKNTILKMVALQKYNESFFVPEEYMTKAMISKCINNDIELSAVNVVVSQVKEPVRGVRIGIKK